MSRRRDSGMLQWRVRNALWDLVPLVAIGVTVGMLANSTWDQGGLVLSARKAACDDRPCRMLQVLRGPFSQTVMFANVGESTISIECHREAIFLGEWACTVVPTDPR